MFTVAIPILILILMLRCTICSIDEDETFMQVKFSTYLINANLERIFQIFNS